MPQDSEQASSLQHHARARRYAIETLQRYWPTNAALIAGLPIKHSRSQETPDTAGLVTIVLPPWAADLGIDAGLLVNGVNLVAGSEAPWQRVAWFQVIRDLLHGVAEIEAPQRPLHSYAFRISDAEPRLWRYAWVNRIAMFLRRWAAHASGQDENTLFGAMPQARIALTHDIDALRKTLAIRLKQSGFTAVNSFRQLGRSGASGAAQSAKKTLSMALTTPDYWGLNDIINIEQGRDLRSRFHVYGGFARHRCGLQQQLFDPGYDCHNPRLIKFMRNASAAGWEFGLHQSFQSWNRVDMQLREKHYLEAVLKHAVNTCRQHWLRFSWRHTWQIQQQAGFSEDATLGFNDRPGFRASAALRFKPWPLHLAEPLKITALPLVLMDSHLYDYQPMDEQARGDAIECWVNEIKAVGGEASFVWHSHVFNQDYGWREGFEQLVEILAAR